MFRGRVFIALTVLFGLAIYMIWLFFHPSPRDYRTYRRLMSYTEADQTIPENKTLLKQRRDQVQKQFLFTQDQQRLQWRIDCNESEMVLDKKGNSIEFSEYLNGMVCQMQEKIIHKVENGISLQPILSDHQLMRSMHAEEAHYNYKSKQLIADQVFLARYKLNGSDWHESVERFNPFMKGSADGVEVFLDKKPRFTAKRFKASFQDLE